jgi:hypothetical protein
MEEVELELDEPLPPAVFGPICLWLLALLWGGLGIWGLSIGAWIGLLLVLASPLCAALAIGWRSYDKRAWETYRAYKESERANLS